MPRAAPSDVLAERADDQVLQREVAALPDARDEQVVVVTDQAELVEACLPALRTYARRLTGDAHMADDCVQDACVRALGAFAGYDPARPFRPWMFRILRNEWLQRLRRDRRLTQMTD